MKRSELVDEVLGNLAGYLTDQEMIGTIVADNDTSVTVSLQDFQPGLVEFGDGELVYVGDVTDTTLSGLIRGYRSTPTADAAGKQVRANPRYPKYNVLMAMNRCLDSLWPDLFQVKTKAIPNALGVTYYQLPEDCEDVLTVAQYDIRHDVALPSAWRKCRYWTFMPDAPIDPNNSHPDYGTTTGKGCQVQDAWQDEQAMVQFTYTTKPGRFETTLTEDEDFTTATGLPEWCEDVVVAGACYRLVSFVSAGEAAARTAEGDLLGTVGQKPQPSDMTELFYSVYKTRLKEATDRMRMSQNIGSVHYSGA